MPVVSPNIIGVDSCSCGILAYVDELYQIHKIQMR